MRIIAHIDMDASSLDRSRDSLKPLGFSISTLGKHLFLRVGNQRAQETEGFLGAKRRKWGIELYEKARTCDESPLVEYWTPKSIGEQETFEKDTLNPDFIFSRFKALCQNVFKRFSESGFSSFRTITITVRFADFQTKTRSRTLPAPANDFQTLHFEAVKLLMPFLDRRENPRHKLIRLIGVKVEKLELYH